MKKIMITFVAVLMVVQFFIPNISQANEYSTCELADDYVAPQVEIASTDKGVVMEWVEIDHPKLQGYKVVISQNNPNPKYSEDGYLAWITNKNMARYVVDNTRAYKNGDFDKYLENDEVYYFSITAVYNCGYKLAGNTKQEVYQGPDRDEYKKAKEKIKEEKEKLKKKKDYYKDVKKFCSGDDPKTTKCFDYDHPKQIKDKRLININKKAKLLNDNRLDEILSELKELRSLVREQQVHIKYLRGLTNDLQGIATGMQTAINNFITYGVDNNTQRLGAGERAAVIHSFKEAFGKLPEDEAELEDVIKIANGRWPSKRNIHAEQKAVGQFLNIYERLPDFENASDDAAVTVMAYGLRQQAENRNLQSEQQGLKIFQDIFGYLPESTDDWNSMQAITYSGASR